VLQEPVIELDPKSDKMNLRLQTLFSQHQLENYFSSDFPTKII
jgi:hypothetical protein